MEQAAGLIVPNEAAVEKHNRRGRVRVEKAMYARVPVKQHIFAERGAKEGNEST